MRLFHPAYGPYNDKFRLEVVLHARVHGFKKTAETYRCSDSSVRIWSKILQDGRISVELHKETG